jgi:hypothetical protein
MYVRPTIVVVLLVGLLGAVLSRTVFPRYLTILAVIGITFWLQGNVLEWNYSVLDGRSIDWTQGVWRGWVDMGIWIAVLSFAVLANLQWQRLIVQFAIGVFALQLVLGALTVVRSADQLTTNPLLSATPNALNEFHGYSSKANVLHIIADGFQADIFDEIVNEENGRSLRGGLEGFVFYKEHLGAFPLTHMTVPALLSGKIYTNQMPINDFLNDAIGGETILSAAHDAGYEVDLAVPGSLGYMYTKAPHTNAYFVPNNAHVTSAQSGVYDATKLFDLSLFRIAPHFLKKYIYNDQLWLVQSRLSEKKYMGLAFFSHVAFLRSMQENISVHRQRPVYKLVHLMLSHNPMVANEQCDYAGKILPTIRYTAKIQARCSLIEIVALFDKMKSQGIYDNTTIILMADHGTWARAKGVLGEQSEDGKYIGGLDPQMVSLAHPLMAIKLPNASDAMTTSTVYSSIIDTAATIANAMHLDSKIGGRSILELTEGEPRSRRHYYYKYRKDDWDAEFLGPILEFIVEGPVLDTNSWRVGRLFAIDGRLE